MVAILPGGIWASFSPWVDLLPLMDVQAGQHSSGGTSAGSGRGIGLKRGESHGWELYLQLKVLKVLRLVCYARYKPLLAPVINVQRSDRRRDYSRVWPMGTVLCAEWWLSEHPIVDAGMVRRVVFVRHPNVRMW